MSCTRSTQILAIIPIASQFVWDEVLRGLNNLPDYTVSHSRTPQCTIWLFNFQGVWLVHLWPGRLSLPDCRQPSEKYLCWEKKEKELRNFHSSTGMGTTEHVRTQTSTRSDWVKLKGGQLVARRKEDNNEV